MAFTDMGPDNFPSRILRLPDVLQLVGLSKSSIYALMKAGQFPQPIHLGARAVGWLLSAVQAWIDSRN